MILGGICLWRLRCHASITTRNKHPLRLRVLDIDIDNRDPWPGANEDFWPAVGCGAALITSTNAAVLHVRRACVKVGNLPERGSAGRYFCVKPLQSLRPSCRSCLWRPVSVLPAARRIRNCMAATPGLVILNCASSRKVLQRTLQACRRIPEDGQTAMAVRSAVLECGPAALVVVEWRSPTDTRLPTEVRLGCCRTTRVLPPAPAYPDLSAAMLSRHDAVYVAVHAEPGRSFGPTEVVEFKRHWMR